MIHVGFCGNVEPHEPHDVLYLPEMAHWGFHCRGVDEEGTINTAERTPINDCLE